MARPIAQAVSLERFRGTDRSTNTTKLFNLERFALYNTTLTTVLLLVQILDMYVCTNFSRDAILGTYCTAPNICGYIFL